MFKYCGFRHRVHTFYFCIAIYVEDSKLQIISKCVSKTRGTSISELLNPKGSMKNDEVSGWENPAVIYDSCH